MTSTSWRSVAYAAGKAVTGIAGDFGAEGAASRPENLRDLLAPYLRAPSFWLVCAMAFDSALFPLLGGVSALAVGVLTDCAGSGNRITLVVPAMAACALSLVVLGIATVRHDLWLSLAAICGTALFLLGPYTLLAGAV